MSNNGSTGCNQKAMLFDNPNDLDTKIDKITEMVTKLTTHIIRAKPFKLNIHPGKRRGQSRTNYYEIGRQQNRNRSIVDRFRRSPYKDKPQFWKNFRRIFKGGNLRNFRNNRFDRSRSGQGDRQSLGNFRRNNKGSSRS